MRILLTGASGAIGSPLIEHLAERGHELHVVSRRGEHSDNESVRWIQADVRDAASLVRACRSEPQVVVHLAAVTHARRAARYDAVNVQGTANLLRALAGVAVHRFVYSSTRAIGVAGGAYAGSKQRAERLITDSGLPWTILRPAEVYGGSGRDPILSLAANLRRRRFVPILGDGSFRLSPVFAADVVRALARSIEGVAAEGQTYVLAGPSDLSYLELVSLLETLQGLPRRRRIHIPIPVARAWIRILSGIGRGEYVPDQIPRLLLAKSIDSSPAARDLEFRPASLEDVLGPRFEDVAGR